MARETMYKLSLKHLKLQAVSSSESRNPFVEHAVEYAIAAAHATFDKDKKDILHKLLLRGLDITILGCNEFYSYRNQNAGMATPLTEVIDDVLKAKWDHERTKFSLPPLMTLLLGEPGSGGSSTPSMVGAVKRWQKSDPQSSLETWRKLSEGNSALEMHLNTLCKLAERNYNVYECVINACSLLTAEKWPERANEPSQAEIVKELLGAREAMLGIRYYMRKMGEAAGIPIEPESQTHLLDTTMSMEGVLLAGVPGAGGFDAVFAVTLGASSKNVTKAWSSLNVLAMLVTEDPRGLSLEDNDPRAKEITAAVSAIQLQS